jgi:hypothetical protein
MRRLLTFLILFMISSGLFATDLRSGGKELTDDTIFISGNTSLNRLDDISYIYNLKPSALNLKWEVTENTVPTAWNISFCDNNNCIDFEFNPKPSNTMKSIVSGDSGSLHLTIQTSNTAGSGYIKFAIYPTNGNIMEAVFLTYIITVNPLSVPSPQAKNFTIYPNPVKDYLNINFSTKGLQHIEVYNILGNKILVKDFENVDYARIPFSNLQRGRYIIMYRPESGKIITKSISKE